jgi:hypothetical protein
MVYLQGKNYRFTLSLLVSDRVRDHLGAAGDESQPGVRWRAEIRRWASG